MAKYNLAARLQWAVEEKLRGNWAELARRTGLTPSTLQQAKAGLDIRFSTLSRIAEALGMTIDEISTEPALEAHEETKIYKTGTGALSGDEEVLLEKYRQLKPSDRTRAHALIDALAPMKHDKTR